MKTIFVLMFVLTTSAFAAETESKCGQVADGVERSNPKTDSSQTRSQGSSSSTAVGR